MWALHKGKVPYNISTRGGLTEPKVRALQHMQTQKEETFGQHLGAEFSFWYRTISLIYQLCHFQLSLKIVGTNHVKQFVRPMQNILLVFHNIHTAIHNKRIQS